MTKLRAIPLCAAASALLCALALPAFAQPAGAPPPAPPPEAAAAPAAPAGSMSTMMAPMAAPKAADDMSGSIGFGVGVAQNIQLLGTTADVAIKWWLHDNLALVPQLAFNLTNVSGAGGGTTWALAPQVVVMFVPFKSTSTRLEIGGGLGFGVGKATPMGNTSSSINIPITAGVEHFFTRWFSMGIAVGENLFSYVHPGGGSANTTSFVIDTGATGAVLAGSLFFYTD